MESRAGWSIGPRTLPPPDGASEELCAMLARAPAPAATPPPEDAQEIKAAARAVDEGVAEVVREAVAGLDVELEREQIAGVGAYRVRPGEPAAQLAGSLFVHLHGGAFVQGRGLAATAEAVEIAALVGIEVLSVDYRTAPDHPAPAAMDDVIAVWRELTAARPAARTALGGTSAGGNLTLVATLRMKELGLALPGALFLGTPACDLAKRGDSRYINDGVDRELVSWDAGPAQIFEHYVGGACSEDPHISPIFGDFAGFPPAYLVSGTRDLLLSDTVRTHRRLRRAGVPADLHVYEGFSHADHITMLGTPELAEHHRELGAFLARHL